MPAPFIIPFNNNPSATSVKTASYTIPAGKYAFVSTSIANLSIDGTTVIPLQSISRAYSTAVNTTTSLNFDPQFSKGIYITTHTLAASAAITVSISYGLAQVGSLITFSSASRSTTGTTTTTLNSLYYGQNWYIASSCQGTLAVGGTLTWVLNYYPLQDFNFWVKTGTVLNGTNYLVTEYNNIS